MSSVEMTAIHKTFGATTALDDFHLTIPTGEMVALLGPSGCGKTTALRILAGFERANSGSVRIDGADITRVPPRRRHFGMVFQDYSLFPNMRARDNIAFGLRAARIPTAERETTVERLLEVTRLTEHADKYPHQLSGGQKQRVALARALAPQPKVLLLDEPLSALDAKVRESLRNEIRRLQRESGVTTLFVTHDQHEAMAVADRVGVMSDGRLVQLAPPEQVYRSPASSFVARFVGTTLPHTARREGHEWRLFGGPVQVTGATNGAHEATVLVRPEQLELCGEDAGIPGHVTDVAFFGAISRLLVDTADGEVTVDLMAAESVAAKAGDAVRVRVRPHGGPVVALEADER